MVIGSGLFVISEGWSLHFGQHFLLFSRHKETSAADILQEATWLKTTYQGNANDIWKIIRDSFSKHSGS